jgi:RND family efflux transporter MFP subunit
MKSTRILIVIVAILAVVFFAGILPRLRAGRALSDREAATSKPVVSIVVAAKSLKPAVVTLPAAINALQDTPIYARTTGFIGKWTADIGDRVKAGQVLAVIDGPDLDQELNQARAALEQARANLEIARISADRWKELGAQNAVAQQDVDQKSADFLAAKAAVVAAQANVDRLAQLKDFQQVTSPYDGVVTARNAEVGNLINAGAGTEIYHVAQTDTLRVMVAVPQANVRSLKVGMGVDILVPEFPGRVFKGEVSRFAGALDISSRTLETEVRLPNPKNELFPGMYGEARFSFPSAQPAILLPSNAAIINTAGTLVAIVGDGDKIHLQHVTLGRDFGNQVEVLDGLTPGSRVVAAPRDSLYEGLEVTPVAADAAAKP